MSLPPEFNQIPPSNDSTLSKDDSASEHAARATPNPASDVLDWRASANIAKENQYASKCKLTAQNVDLEPEPKMSEAATPHQHCGIQNTESEDNIDFSERGATRGGMLDDDERTKTPLRMVDLSGDDDEDQAGEDIRLLDSLAKHANVGSNDFPKQSPQTTMASNLIESDDYFGLPELPDAPSFIGDDGMFDGQDSHPLCHPADLDDSTIDTVLRRFHGEAVSKATSAVTRAKHHNASAKSDTLQDVQLSRGGAESSLFFEDRSESPSSRSYKEEESKLPEDDIKDEDSDMDVEIIEIPDDSPTQKSKGKGGRAKSKLSNKVSTDKVTKAVKNGKRGRPLGSRNRKEDVGQPQVANLYGLFNNDIIAQAAVNQGMAQQPALAGTNRQRALKQLIASLPEDQRDLYRGDKVELDEAAKNFVGRGRKVTAMRAHGEDGWLLKGMKSYLQHHQLLGAAFMRRREKEGNPYGGVIGDVMGFGKTVICLANMVDGMPLKNHEGPRATLIVAPSALLNQWRSEISKHLEPDTFRNIMMYKAGNRLTDTSGALEILAAQDVVITSYHEVMSSYPVNDPPETLTTPRAQAEWWERHLQETKGHFHRIKWHRVVLDESQIIKNHLSRTSIAIRALEGKYRWVLSGTPVLNSLKEWYSTLDFLQMPHIGKFELFCKNFCRANSPKALQRLQVTLGKIMMRRTHESKLFGRPIVKLPEIKPVRTVEVEFNSVERAIYTIVGERFCKRLSPIGTGERNYRSVLVLLLRLRQLVGHPLLIQKTLREILEAPDLEQLWHLTDPSITSAGQAALDGSRGTAQALEAALVYMSSDDKVSIRAQQADNQLSAELRKYLLDLEKKGDWAKVNARTICAACLGPPCDALITQCKHMYCKACLNDIFFAAQLKGRPVAPCRECGNPIIESATWNAKAYDEAKKRNDITAEPSSADDDADWFDLGGPMLRSSKVSACIEQLREWFVQDHTNKVIVFVQFRGLIRIISQILDEERWGHVTFDGSMSFDARNKAIEEFTDNKDTMVLIAALKAGGVGLNLTAANKIVIIDVWWNQLTEDQAFSRAYRIGQTREVEVVRFVVKNSIDSKIIELQAKKTKEINSALRTGSRPRLSVAEMMALFGDLQKPKPKNVATNDSEQQNNEGPDESFIPPDDPYDNRINSGNIETISID